MAGKIQFDREKVVSDALILFWQKGYAATSMQDIKATTGIKESSLYNTFGSKKELFLEALKLYAGHVGASMGALPAKEHPAEAIRIFLRQIASRACNPDTAIGCLLMNSALELGPEHQDIVDFAMEQFAQIEKWMQRTIEHAQSLGEIPADKDPKSLARFLTYSVQSLFTIARTRPTEEFMTDIVNTTLSVLE